MLVVPDVFQVGGCELKGFTIVRIELSRDSSFGNKLA